MRTNILLPAVLVILVGLVFFSDMQRRKAQVQVDELSARLQQQSEETNREQAQEIVARVRAHMDIPSDTEPTVATIVDVEKLRERNPFYNKAQNGDFLIVTPTRAILYRQSDDRILDVVPVELNQAAVPLQGASASAASS